MHGVENRLVARAAVFQQHRVVEEMTTPRIVVILTVVAKAVRAEIAVWLLKRHRGPDAGGGFRYERIVAKRVCEQRRAEGVFSPHFSAPAHQPARAIGGVEVTRHIRLRHLVGFYLAKMSAHA